MVRLALLGMFLKFFFGEDPTSDNSKCHHCAAHLCPTAEPVQGKDSCWRRVWREDAEAQPQLWVSSLVRPPQGAEMLVQRQAIAKSLET